MKSGKESPEEKRKNQKQKKELWRQTQNLQFCSPQRTILSIQTGNKKQQRKEQTPMLLIKDKYCRSKSMKTPVSFFS